MRLAAIVETADRAIGELCNQLTQDGVRDRELAYAIDAFDETLVEVEELVWPWTLELDGKGNTDIVPDKSERDGESLRVSGNKRIGAAARIARSRAALAAARPDLAEALRLVFDP